MDQEKIGKFIAKCRKEKKLTQEQLAEKLNITYKAVSKWETGKGMPDSSIMIDLCKILDISVNDLFNGSKIESSKALYVADQNLVKLKKEKEAMFNAARYGYGISIILLFVYNIVNVVKLGVEKTVSHPIWIIMILSSLTFYITYLHLINKK